MASIYNLIEGCITVGFGGRVSAWSGGCLVERVASKLTVLPYKYQEGETGQKPRFPLI